MHILYGQNSKVVINFKTHVVDSKIKYNILYICTYHSFYYINIKETFANTEII